MENHSSAAELTLEGALAVIRLGPRTSALLPERGFSPGGDLVALLTWERLEIRPVRELRSYWEKLDEITREIAFLEELVRHLIVSLPEPTDAMASHQIPFSLEADLRTTLELVLADEIRPARVALQEALEMTPERLRADWERQRGDHR